MCGIAVVVSSEKPVPDGAIEKMVASVRHRGPDAQTFRRLPFCDLGHTRLSIIDLASGDQPMTEQQERYWIVYNGELFNYRELRTTLERMGWPFRTNSDTEVLLLAYLQYGKEVVSHLNGQFAFAIWDHNEQRLFAARDRLGEKPLYFAFSDDGYFLLASEIKALLASGLLQPKLDRASVDAYLALLYVPPHRTIYTNVQTLLPGHALTWQRGNFRQWQYWQPKYSNLSISDPREIVEQVRLLIGQAVRRQMVADVPVGAFLSGGLDSSTIVAMMSQCTAQPVMTFSVGFGDLIDELPYAQQVAQTYQTQHHEIQMSIPVGDMVERMSEVYDEPFADSSNIPTYLISEFAHRYVKVVLSGDGGDELFGGYAWYKWLLSDQTLDTSSANLMLGKLTSLSWRALSKVGFPIQAMRNQAVENYQRIVFKRRYPDYWQRHIAGTTQLYQNRADLWNGKVPAGVSEDICAHYLPADEVQDIDRAIDFDVRAYLPGDILVKVDRAALAHGLETRAPFLDVELVEFMLSIRHDMRLHNQTLKYLLREACSDLWPDALIRRAKQGFGAPIQYWLKRPDVQQLVNRVCQQSSELAALLPGVPSAFPRLGPQQQWTLLCLGLWLERHHDCVAGS